MASRWYNPQHTITNRGYSLRVLCAGSIFFSLLYAVTRFTDIRLCLVYHLFGRECIGCGISRGMVAALHGDWCAATAHHVLSVPLLCGLCLYYILLVVDILFDTACARRLERCLGHRRMYWLYGALLVLAAAQKWHHFPV